MILYIEVENLENVFSKCEDDWSKIERGKAYWKKKIYHCFILI